MYAKALFQQALATPADASRGRIAVFSPNHQRDIQNIVVPEQAAVVKRIFKLRASGESYASICARLNAEKVSTQRRGKWHVSTVRRIVSNLFYTGRVECDGKRLRGQHEAIVPGALFRRVAARN